MRRRLGWVAIVGIALVGVLAPVTRATGAGPTPYPGGTWSPEPATYGVYAEKNVQVEMTDHVKLTVDVYYPADADGSKAAGDFPALLTQTPYSGSIGAADLASDTGPGAYFVERGYIYVSADVRGTGRSGGNGEFFGARDAQDGVDLVNWIVTDLLKDEHDPVVGLHGCSYLGHTQVYTAAALAAKPSLAEHVKAMIPMCVSSDPYRDTYMENGIPTPAWEGAGLAAGTLLGPTIEAYMVPQYLDSQAGGPNAYDSDAPDAFWRLRDHLRDVPAIVETGIPALLWNGWNDSGFGGLELYSALQNEANGRPWEAPLRTSDSVDGKYQLILGDWSHGGGLDEGVELQWYDTWLKGLPTGMPTTTSTPVHVQDRVTHQWRNLSAYPFVPGAKQLAIPSTLPTTTLAFGPSETPGTTLEYDLGDVGGQVLAGPTALHVEASTAAKDVMLRTELYDVAPGGAATLVTWGSILGSMRTTDHDRSWTDDAGKLVRPFLSLRNSVEVPPGTVQYEIPVDPTLWTFQTGHHLRLRLLSLPDQSLCQQKQQAITTSAVGCRPRSGVLANLLGGQYTISLRDSYLNIPLVDPGTLGADQTGTPADGRPVPLPINW